MSLSRQMLWFATAGAAGFLVDTAVLYMLMGVLGLYVSRIASFGSAALVTWIINRSVTFRSPSSEHVTAKEFLAYLGLMLFGGIINYALYALLVLEVEFVAQHPIFGVAAGSIAGMSVNFATSRAILFRSRQDG